MKPRCVHAGPSKHSYGCRSPVELVYLVRSALWAPRDCQAPIMIKRAHITIIINSTEKDMTRTES